jgi:ATP dependent DNA ligase-like protein
VAASIKHDGFRVIARKVGERVKLYSRPGNELTKRFPLIVQAVAKLRASSCIIDGEAVACGEDGIACFELLLVRWDADGGVFLYAGTSCFEKQRGKNQATRSGAEPLRASANAKRQYGLHRDARSFTFFHCVAGTYTVLRQFFGCYFIGGLMRTRDRMVLCRSGSFNRRQELRQHWSERRRIVDLASQLPRFTAFSRLRIG